MVGYKRFFLLSLIFITLLFNLSTIFSASCWLYTTNATCASSSNGECVWKTDSWGGWCQELNCWSLYTQNTCTSTNVPGKNCTWSSGGTTYSCEELSCMTFSGTNVSTCENNTANLGCTWKSQCYTEGYSPETNCWLITSEATCSNTTGCKWGQCEQKSCWNYNTNSTCTNARDWNGNNCTWDGNYCSENGCWKFYTNATCANAKGLNCEWKYDSCQSVNCWSWDFTNANTCVNNSFNLSCEWTGSSYCNKKSCWNYGQTQCQANPKCNWRAWTSSGWCEEINCWSWDSWKGGSQSACTQNASIYNLGCTWNNMTSDGVGWCSKDYSLESCSNKTTEKTCMDTNYCWWQYNNWNNPSQGGNCSEPSNFGLTTNTSILTQWNPGCYIFDINITDCGLVLGCDNSTAGVCAVNTIHPYYDEINANGINCTMINDSQLCNNIPILSSCCSWQSGNCTTNKLSTACWDQMKQKTEDSCSDAKTKGKCDEIANYPWYMLCAWTNSTETCDFKASSVFGNSSQSLTFIDNKKNCEAAGGKWIVENYCEGAISVPSGRCEYKFNEEEDCDKACFACENYDSNSNVVNSTNAESACKGSALNYCEYTANTNAPNGIGYCNAKEQIKKGIASNCDSNCGDCTYLGDPLTNDTNRKPSYFCGQSKANSANGGCKWITDNSTTQGGYCMNKGEKTCEDSCDRCTTQLKCQDIGRTAMANQSGSCKWQGDSNTGSCVANIVGDVEICWDGIDNNDNSLIDCADSSCYSDSFCGFVSGDCFGWTTKASCDAQNLTCEWVSDNWGSWCDFKGSQCWKYNTNINNCSTQANCQWNNGTGGAGWCEKDWSLAEACMGLNKTSCDAASGSSCNWTIDTWCQGAGNATTWCQTQGGWCDHLDFAPKNCWSYNSGSSACNAVSGCSWHTDTYSTQMCEVNWSSQCWLYSSNSTCTNASCLWKADSWGGWCTNLMDQCWNLYTSSSCNLNSNCYWQNSSSGGFCQPICNNGTHINNQTLCGSVQGCSWRAESGWCEEAGSCWNFDQTGCTNATGQSYKCRWKNPGWCDPESGGFSGASISSGGGIGNAIGADCYRYDGNQTLCTNKTIINISCGWTVNSKPNCDVDWGANCWKYTLQNDCNASVNCWWNNQSGGSGWCTNLMDQCWNNLSYQISNNSAGWLGNCTSNVYCTNNSWNSCEPKCFGLSQTSCTNATYLGKCRYNTGWCNPATMNDMFVNMEAGAPVPLGTDLCNGTDTSQQSVDLCGFGLKDMGTSYGFGANVRDFSNSSVCNKEKLSSFVMGMFDAGVGMGFAGGSSSSEKIGSGNDNLIYLVYLDSDGSTTGSCTLTNNQTSEGYEFRFKYTSEWNSSKEKAVETFNAYKCDNSNWVATDIKLSAWKKKMCSEIGGPMIAVEKVDLERFPTLYDSTKDMRIYVATFGNSGNISSPLDVAGPSWTTPGSVDFEINSAFAYGADTAKFEDILRKGFVKGENCFNNSIDDDGDGNIDCNDWDCQYASICSGLGINVAGYVDTSSPLITGIKIEEYPDGALIMHDTNKPSNGTLMFYNNDTQCLTLNTSIFDLGILKNNTVRQFKLWHSADIYKDANSLAYSLTNDTTYYYKLKVCDSNGKCSLSKCSSFRTSSETKCPYCNFVTRLKIPTGWDVSYDLDTDGIYEHTQGQVCGANAGMKTNYTTGRKANIKLNKSDGTAYIEFLNVTLTKTSLNDKVRTISTSGDVIGDTTKVGLTSETRDKIINNLHPEVCRIKIPFSGTCNTLYHCDDSGNNCVDKTTSAGGAPIDATNCIWNAPYCEFSTYKTNTATSPSDSSSGGGGGSGGAGASTYTISETELAEGYTKEIYKNDKFKFDISEETHYTTLKSFTSTTATINVSSESQIATLEIGEEKNFELTNDNINDISVKVNSINMTSNKVSLTIKSISEEEKISLTGEVTGEETKTEGEISSDSSKKILIGIIITLVILSSVIIGIKKYSHRR